MGNTTTLNETLRSPIDGTEYVRLATPGANWRGQLSSISRTKLNAVTTYYVNVAQGTIVGGSGYIAGTYDRVPLTGGSGTNMLARITVGAGGNVTDLIPDSTHLNGGLLVPPTGYVPGDVLSASNANLGGSGSGFTWTLTTVGNDANDGKTVATAWATMQHGANFIAQKIDINGWIVDLQLEDGIYPGVFLAFYPICGFFRIRGNGSDNSRVEINSALNNFTVIEIDDFCAFMEFRDFTVNLAVPSNIWFCFSAFECDAPGSALYFPNIRVIGNNAAHVAWFIDCAFVNWFIGVTANISLPDGTQTGNPHPGCQIRGTFADILEFEASHNFIGLGGNWTLESSPTWATGFCNIGGDYNEIFNFGNDFTYTGSVGANSPRFNFAAQCGIVTGGVGATFFPGSVAGTLKTPFAVYDGAPVTVTVAGLPAASSFTGAEMFVTDSTATISAGLGNVVAGTGGNKVPVYSDGTNWRIG